MSLHLSLSGVFLDIKLQLTLMLGGIGGSRRSG